jgi:hypothetical protein
VFEGNMTIVKAKFGILSAQSFFLKITAVSLLFKDTNIKKKRNENIFNPHNILNGIF